MPRDVITINREWEQHTSGYASDALLQCTDGPYERVTITMHVHKDDSERRALVHAIEDLIHGYRVRTGELKLGPDDDERDDGNDESVTTVEIDRNRAYIELGGGGSSFGPSLAALIAEQVARKQG